MFPSREKCFLTGLAFILTFSFSKVSWAATAPPAPVLLPGSIQSVESSNLVGPPSPYKAEILRAALRPDESAAKMTFEVALKMRNFSELQQRIARGERI